MAIKHFKASKYAPESPSALKVAPFLTITTLDRELRSEKSNLLPAAVILEKGTPISARAPGPSTLYVIEGELEFEDTSDPGQSIMLTAGDVIFLDEGTSIKVSTPSRAKAFGAGYTPGGSLLTDFIFP